MKKFFSHKEKLQNTFNGAIAKAKTTIGQRKLVNHGKEDDVFNFDDDPLEKVSSNPYVEDLTSYNEEELEEEEKGLGEASGTLASTLPSNVRRC
jgi:hypothetical protein